MPQTLSQIQSLLNAYGIRPKKRYGQHFLHDSHHMAKLVAAARIMPDDVVLEVGPGTGALSEHILECGAKLVAVEVDRDFQPILERQLVKRFGDRVTLIFEDVLSAKHVINPVVRQAMGTQEFKLISNLPYNIASPLLANLAMDRSGMSMAVVTIQREVAVRLLASPGSKEYGPLGVIVEAMCQVQRIASISSGCFWPEPKVESVVVRLSRRDPPLTDDPDALSALVHRLFTKRRKQLGTILGRATPLPADISPSVRPEQLSVEQLVRLLGSIGGGDKAG